MTGKVPAKVLTGKSIPLKDMHPFGARCKVLHHLPSKRTLTARTSGDLRNSADENTSFDTNAINIVDTSQKSSFNGTFLGFSNHNGIILVLRKGTAEEPDRLARVRHTIIDHYGLSASPTDSMSPNEKLLQQFHSSLFDDTREIEEQNEIQGSNFDSVDSPFDPSKCITLDITLPVEGVTLGLHIDTDEDYLLPILGRVSYNSPIYDEIPEKFHYYKYWIIQVQDQFPITASGCRDALYYYQQPTSRKIQITLCQMDEPVRYPHQSYRAIFDSCTTKRFASMKYGHMITSPVEPTVHHSINKCLKDPKYGDDWELALYHQYDKNDAVKLTSQPTPIENVPKDKTIHRAVISTKVKKKGDSLWQMVTRMCADGSKQQQGIDFEYSYSPTTGAPAVKFVLAIAAAYGWIISIIDIVNCFQSTLIPEEERLVISTPPKYIDWFKRRYPKVKLEESPSNRYVLQLLNGLQGDKSIGRKWYLLLKEILERFGFVVCPHEPSLFVYEKNDVKFILNTSTDDFLCAHSDDQIYEDLCTYLKQYFSITTNTGTELKYLNIRIIQSDHGISYDQTEHIHKMLKKYFPDEKIADSTMKEVHTPFRTDNQFEIDLLEQLPATKEQLKLLEKKYGAGYSSILGDLMHIWVFSRPDSGYAITRLSQYTHAPSAAAFAGLYRCLRYFATHPHRPIFFKRQEMTGSQEMRVDFDHPNHTKMTIPNSVIEMVDADHARDNATRKSCHCVLALINGVVIHWKMQQQKCIALHSTDSEIRGCFAATKEGTYLQDLCSFLQIDKSMYKPLPIYVDSKPAIDSIKANTVTNRVKHIAVPILFMHEQTRDNRIDLRWIDTKLNLADSGTKPNPAPTHFRHFDQAIGVRFYPPAESDHYKALQLHNFKYSPYTKTTNSKQDDPICSESTSSK